jgi:hypothetical protein
VSNVVGALFIAHNLGPTRSQPAESLDRLDITVQVRHSPRRVIEIDELDGGANALHGWSAPWTGPHLVRSGRIPDESWTKIGVESGLTWRDPYGHARDNEQRARAAFHANPPRAGGLRERGRPPATPDARNDRIGRPEARCRRGAAPQALPPEGRARRRLRRCTPRRRPSRVQVRGALEGDRADLVHRLAGQPAVARILEHVADVVVRDAGERQVLTPGRERMKTRAGSLPASSS